MKAGKLLAATLTGVWLLAPTATAVEPSGAIRPVPFTAVKVQDEFWKPRLDTNAKVTATHNLDECERTGRLSNFAKAAGKMQGKHQGLLFDDSDVYKALEGCAYVLMTHPDEALEARCDAIIADIAAAQGEDGYLNTYYTLVAPEKRWQELHRSHELYCAGHLIEAGLAYKAATGKGQLLDVAVRFAELIDREFGPEARKDPPGHQEIELALVKLHEATGEARWLDLARFFLETRGRAEGRKSYGTYSQDHLPVADQREAVGHAVRAVYMYMAMTDIARIAGDAPYRQAVEALWKDIVDTKLYITGGIGGIPGHEGFGDPYELPNKSAYNETCAAIANALWCHRMFLLTGDFQYMDVAELSIYNSVLSGISFDGDKFFYPNPLEADAFSPFNHGQKERCPWFNCACCPPNVLRFLPQVPGMAYAFDDESIYVNFFIAGTVTIDAPFGRVVLKQETGYPFELFSHIEIVQAPEYPFTIRVRQPGWSNGKPVPSDLYRLQLSREALLRAGGNAVKDFDHHKPKDGSWRPGDLIRVAFYEGPQQFESHPSIVPNRDHVALMRGPLVYCIEGADHRGVVRQLALREGTELKVFHNAAFPPGASLIAATAASIRRNDEGDTLIEKFPLTAIPYYAWCHRGRGEMKVWIPTDPAAVKPLPPPTTAGRATPSASHTWGSDSPMAMNDGDLPKSSSDGNIIRHTFWPRRGTQEWVQYDLVGLTEVSSVKVYWFDDTGKGSCRVPASWRVMYQDAAGDWKAVDAPATAFGIAKDEFNVVEFPAVKAKALRLEIQLRENMSAGILEWVVN